MPGTIYGTHTRIVRSTRTLRHEIHPRLVHSRPCRRVAAHGGAGGLVVSRHRPAGADGAVRRAFPGRHRPSAGRPRGGRARAGGCAGVPSDPRSRVPEGSPADSKRRSSADRRLRAAHGRESGPAQRRPAVETGGRHVSQCASTRGRSVQCVPCGRAGPESHPDAPGRG
jgi:hypothetical protein